MPRSERSISRASLLPAEGESARLRVATTGEAPHAAPSPALLMQQRLAGEIARDDRWSWRMTVAFVLLTCSAFWTGLYGLLRLVVG